MAHTEPIAHDSTEGLIFLVIGGACVTGLLYAAGWTSAHLSGHPTPHGGPLAEVLAFAHGSDPSKAWGGSPVGPPVLYWFVTGLFVVIAGLLAWLGYRLVHGSGLPHWGTRTRKQEVHDGLAERSEVSELAGEKALMRRAKTLRPSLPHPEPHDVGYRLGKAWGLDVWASVECRQGLPRRHPVDLGCSGCLHHDQHPARQPDCDDGGPSQARPGRGFRSAGLGDCDRAYPCNAVEPDTGMRESIDCDAAGACIDTGRHRRGGERRVLEAAVPIGHPVPATRRRSRRQVSG